jgi:hypothetical protein
MEFFENTTTPLDLVMSVNKYGIGLTNRGYDRYPQGHDLYVPSECDVCNATGDIILRNKDTTEGLCEDCVSESINEAQEIRAGEYANYSLDTLTVLAQDYAFKLGNGENYGQIYGQVLEAIKVREKNDYCRHDNFKWNEDLCQGCEMGE